MIIVKLKLRLYKELKICLNNSSEGPVIQNPLDTWLVCAKKQVIHGIYNIICTIAEIVKHFNCLV